MGLRNRARLILFDVDQTLVSTAGAGMRSMEEAAREVLGISLEGIRPDGLTDPAILREAMRRAGIPAWRWRALEEEVWSLYASLLEQELGRPDLRRRIKPGVEELLERLDREAGAHLALLTGNLEVTAHLKLACFGLNRYFPVGAFGSDCADRRRLARVALERCRRHYRLEFQPRHVWVIGDTPHDVEAARAIGARSLAVATGSYPLPRLEESIPTKAMADLGDVAGVFRLLMEG